MKNSITYTFLTLLLLFALNGNSQNKPVKPGEKTEGIIPCLTEVTPAQMKMELNRNLVDYRLIQQEILNTPPSPLTRYSIQLHFLRNDNETNTGNVPTVAQIRSEITNYVNPYFNTNILNATFIECGPEMYHNSTAYNSLSSYAEGYNMSQAYNVANVINIYFVEYAQGACGWARFPADLPEDYIVILYDCGTNQSTLVHEIGHYFDIYHTHETAFGAENVTRNQADACYDCDVDGDLLCDTEADPNLSGNVFSNTCNFANSNGNDACNVPYTPDPYNIMSYSAKACRTIFTTGQQLRMAAAMAGSRSYLTKNACCFPPIANCKPATIQLGSNGSASLTPSMVDNGSSAGCGIASRTVNPSSFTCADLGSNTVTLTVTDNDGNSSTCTATVTVEDEIGPTVTCPTNIAVPNDLGQCGAIVNFIVSATDNCSGVGVVSTPASGSSFPVGLTVVNSTATDAAGNTANCSFNVVVTDSEDPTVVTKNIDVTLAGGKAEIYPSDVNDASSDNCGILSMSVLQNSFTCADIGPNTVSLTVNDIYGNSASANATVTVLGEVPTCIITSVPTSNVYTGGVPTTLYLGYGPKSTILDVAPSGGSIFTYSWSGNTSLLSSTTAANPEFTPVAAGPETYTVLVTNEYGCYTTCNITIDVFDVRCGKKNDKVLVCHNGQTICINPDAVATHLLDHVGDYLGPCSSSNKIVFDGDDLTAIASPSPFSSGFTLEIYSTSDAPLNISIFDMTGKTLESYKNIHAHDVPIMGYNLARGMYVVTIEQNGKLETIKVTKSN